MLEARVGITLCESTVEERSAVDPLKPGVYSGLPPDLAELMVCEPLGGVVAHARFQRHNAAHLAILHGGVTLQTRSGAANMDQHLSSPETRRCLAYQVDVSALARQPDRFRAIEGAATLRPLAFPVTW